MVRTVRDNLNRTIQVPDRPQRIVSLVPSQTELLFDLGLETEVVGLTKFCVHPEEKFRSLPRVGGTKDVKHEVVADLRPDLIIANKEENTEEDVAQLMQHYPVWVSDVRSADDGFRLVSDIGALTNTAERAAIIREELEHSWNEVKGIGADRTVVYLIWNNPLMVAGADTFIHAVLDWCGLRNLAITLEGRYPEVGHEWLYRARPDMLLLSSEPFPFKEKHRKELAQLWVDEEGSMPAIALADGELFSWYGSRLLHSPEYFKAFFRRFETT